MANPNLLLLEHRKRILMDIKGEENKQRKRRSFKQTEVQNGRLTQYVTEDLESQLDVVTVKQMPKIDTLNIQKRILKEISTVYSKPAIRRYTGMDDDQVQSIEDLYKQAKVNSKLKRSNESFKLQSQNHLMIIPKKKKLIMRVLRQHHIDAVPDEDDPEEAFAYITSSFDRAMVKDGSKPDTPTGRVGISQPNQSRSDQQNQTIADPEDYKASLERYTVWTRELNFKMNGKAEIILSDGNKVADVDPNNKKLVDQITSPLKEYNMMPFVDVSVEKDFELFPRQEGEITDFTVQFNSSATDVNHTVRMQAWAQAVMKGPAKMMAEEVRVGINRILKLVVDKETGIETDFEYVQTGADIEGSKGWLGDLLALFLTTLGVDPKVISAARDGQSFTSGFERLLSLFEKFAANEEDFEIYKEAEVEIFKIITAWHDASIDNPNLLDKKSLAPRKIGEDATINVIHNKPEAVQTEQERVENHERKTENGLTSRIEFFQKEFNLDRAEALAKVTKLDLDNQLIEAATDPSRHRHEETSYAINVGDGKHIHIDLKTGEMLSPAKRKEGEGDTHTHVKEDKTRTSKPIEGGF